MKSTKRTDQVTMKVRPRTRDLLWQITRVTEESLVYLIHRLARAEARYLRLPAAASDYVGPHCADCGRPYHLHGADIVFSTEDWALLTGKQDGSVILCGLCIANRAMRIPGIIGISASLYRSIPQERVK